MATGMAVCGNRQRDTLDITTMHRGVPPYIAMHTHLGHHAKVRAVDALAVVRRHWKGMGLGAVIISITMQGVWLGWLGEGGHNEWRHVAKPGPAAWRQGCQPTLKDVLQRAWKRRWALRQLSVLQQWTYVCSYTRENAGTSHVHSTTTTPKHCTSSVRSSSK